jgi:hypothetical protein
MMLPPNSPSGVSSRHGMAAEVWQENSPRTAGASTNRLRSITARAKLALPRRDTTPAQSVETLIGCTGTTGQPDPAAQHDRPEHPGPNRPPCAGGSGWSVHCVTPLRGGRQPQCITHILRRALRRGGACGPPQLAQGQGSTSDTGSYASPESFSAMAAAPSYCHVPCEQAVFVCWTLPALHCDPQAPSERRHLQSHMTTPRRRSV